MAFLDNSGDIILDAVLTDTGRFRLAKGDGSFKVVKFALGDDEINYGSYDKSHASGSAYYDLEILQTPVLEAFTNNTSTMNSKLISIPRTNLLYLPVSKLSGPAAANGTSSSLGTPNQFDGTFVVAVDLDTRGESGNSSKNGLLQGDGTENITATQGVLDGYDPFTGDNFIRIDQGLDTIEISADYQIDADLNETQYIIQIDNRFGTIVTPPNASGQDRAANVSFIDDDNIASYYLSLNTDQNIFVYNLTSADNGTSQIDGPKGTSLRFRIQASTDLQTSRYLFDQLGSTGLGMTIFKGEVTPSATLANGGSTMSVRYIDTIVKVTGATTGYSVDIPVRFVKKV